MKKIFVLVFTAFVFFIVSCEHKNDTSAEKNAVISKIDSMEKILFNSKSFSVDKKLAHNVVNSYLDFAKNYSDDSAHCAEYLFRASELANAMKEYFQAINYLSRICKNYPKFKKIPECIFLQGFYYQEFLKDTIRAKEFYEQLISKYPTHAFANDAKALMNMFGKSEEVLIKEFEKKETN
ncbi:MAG: tetratricopeptide repeat protein [Bacteroidota bacterium]